MTDKWGGHECVFVFYYSACLLLSISPHSPYFPTWTLHLTSSPTCRAHDRRLFTARSTSWPLSVAPTLLFYFSAILFPLPDRQMPIHMSDAGDSETGDGVRRSLRKQSRLMSKTCVRFTIHLCILTLSYPLILTSLSCETCKAKKSRCDSSRPQCDTCRRKGRTSIFFIPHLKHPSHHLTRHRLCLQRERPARSATWVRTGCRGSAVSPGREHGEDGPVGPGRAAACAEWTGTIRQRWPRRAVQPHLGCTSASPAAWTNPNTNGRACACPLQYTATTTSITTSPSVA